MVKHALPARAMHVITRVLRDRNFILVLAISLDLLVGENAAKKTQPAVLPLLALAMTLCTMNVSSSDFLSVKSMPQTLVYSLLLNYAVLGGSLLLMAWWLIDDSEIWTGFVLLAAVPPAVAVAPFSHSLGGNARFAVVGMIACYVAAIGIIPGAMLIFLGVECFDPLRLLIILGELVVAPILASRILRLTAAARHIGPWRGTVVNWSFFVIIFTLIGLNRTAFFGEFDILLRICAIGFATTFVLAHLIELVFKAARSRHDVAVRPC